MITNGSREEGKYWEGTASLNSLNLLYLASLLIPLVSSSHMIQSSYKGGWEM